MSDLNEKNFKQRYGFLKDVHSEKTGINSTFLHAKIIDPLNRSMEQALKASNIKPGSVNKSAVEVLEECLTRISDTEKNYSMDENYNSIK